jgi:hypothetical protein
MCNTSLTVSTKFFLREHYSLFSVIIITYELKSFEVSSQTWDRVCTSRCQQQLSSPINHANRQPWHIIIAYTEGSFVDSLTRSCQLPTLASFSYTVMSTVRLIICQNFVLKSSCPISILLRIARDRSIDLSTASLIVTLHWSCNLCNCIRLRV